MRWTEDEIQVPPSKWSLQAIVSISKLPGKEPIDLARREMARSIVRFCEIDDPEFPAPEVFRDGVGFVHLKWIAETSAHGAYGTNLGARVLEFQISRPNSFRGVIWWPGKRADVEIAGSNHVERARRLFGAFWPGGNGVGVGEMMDLLEVRR